MTDRYRQFSEHCFVSAKQILEIDFQSLIGDVKDLDCIELTHRLHVASTSHAAVDRDAIFLLSEVIDCRVAHLDDANPLKAKVSFAATRSPLSCSLTTNQIMELAKAAPKLPHLGLRARITDAVWHIMKKKDHKIGKIAVTSYCSIVSALTENSSEDDGAVSHPLPMYSIDALLRACIIARMIGWDKPEFSNLKRLISHLVNIAHSSLNHSGFCRISKVALSQRLVDANQISSQAEELAKHDALTPKPHDRYCLWKLASHVHIHENNIEDYDRCRMQGAECLVEVSKFKSNVSRYELYWLTEALRYYPKNSNTKSRRDEINSDIIKAQQRARSEYITVKAAYKPDEKANSMPLDLSESTLSEAISLLLECDKIREPEELKEMARDWSNFSSIVPIVGVGNREETLFVAGGSGKKSNEEEEGIMFAVSQERKIQRAQAVVSYINPIRSAIYSKFAIDESVFLPYINACPFVAPGYECSFAKGMTQFICGDDISAAHILVHQLEPCLRHILLRNGVDTMDYSSKNHQTEATLGKLLSKYRERLESILSKGICYEADLLFSFRGGLSLRNTIAHRKVPDDSFNDPNVIYGCWFILHVAHYSCRHKMCL